MPSSPTIVINSAGTGSRLGMGQTKSLVEILGRPLIEWQLDLLDDVEDIRMVVGYGADAVISRVSVRRPDVIFVFNHNYRATLTGDSLLLATKHVSGVVVSLDGDLLVRPSHFRDFLSREGSLVGVTPATTSDAIFVKIEGYHGKECVTAFSDQRISSTEWTGLIKVQAPDLATHCDPDASKNHVYKIVTPMLPIPALQIDAREIDTPADYQSAIEWMQRHLQSGEWKR